MKAVIILSLFFIAVFGNDLLEFKKFMTKYNKNYETAEFDVRFKNFQNNMRRAEEYSISHPSATFGVTKFSDLSKEEFKQIYLPSDMTKQMEWSVASEFTDSEIVASLNKTWDWREHGVVTPVKNQGQCGSCWSFSTTGNVEGQWALAGNSLVGLSEQNLVDCDHHCFEYEGENVCDAGCDGGLMPNAFMYIMGNNGIDTEASYPYTAVDGTCAFKTGNVGATIKNWTYVSRNETQMAMYSQLNGPLSIAVDAEAWQVYIGGVFQDPWCGTTLDHGVLIVGFSYEYNIIGEYTEYWIVKNSWGADWGEDGYIYLERGTGECAVNAFPCSATM